MQPKHLHHKMGGRVTAVTCIEHVTDGETRVPFWFYVCDVDWSDGTSSKATRVFPDKLACDGSNPEAVAEINKLSEQLSGYLRERGTWLKKAKWVGDYLMHWKAKKPHGALLI